MTKRETILAAAAAADAVMYQRMEEKFREVCQGIADRIGMKLEWSGALWHDYLRPAGYVGDLQPGRNEALVREECGALPAIQREAAEYASRTMLEPFGLRYVVGKAVTIGDSVTTKGEIHLADCGCDPAREEPCSAIAALLREEP